MHQTQNETSFESRHTDRLSVEMWDIHTDFYYRSKGI